MKTNCFNLIEFCVCCIFASMSVVDSQANQNSKSSLIASKLSAMQSYQALVSTTPAYRTEALRLILEGANQMAHDLNLSETSPIVPTNLLAAYISPPRMAQGSKVIGNIATSNYVYAPFFGSRFSLVRTRLQEEYSQIQRQYLWPMTQMDTNAAYQTATQILKAASIDVEGLNRDCVRTIRAFTPEGEHGKNFVPVYWVSWSKDERPIASVELLEPTKTIRQLHVNKSEYILRPPLQITNLDYLLSQTNAPANTNAPAEK